MLKIVKCGGELIVGKVEPHSSVLASGIELQDPMNVVIQEQIVPAKINGAPPQRVKGFALLPIPSRKITIVDFLFFGEVDAKDGLAELYIKVLERMEEQRKSPLLVTQ